MGLEIVGGKEGDVVNTVTSKLKFHHYFVKCVLTCSTKTLPKWGFQQGEVSCNRTSRDPHAMWNVEDNHFSKLPNSSVHDLAPSFFSRFIESHKVMLQGNSGLKPKEGEMTSKPWEWPINLRGQWFSAGDDKTRIFLLGNPVIWWANIIFLIIFLVIYSYSSFKSQRGVSESPVLIDYILTVARRMLPSSLSSPLTHTVLGLVVAGCWYSFYLFSPLVYGMEGGEYARESNSSMHHLHWMESWEF